MTWPTIRLIRSIGSPFVSGVDLPKDNNETTELYHYAIKNRIKLLFLTTLKRNSNLGYFRKIYDDAYEKSQGTYGAISRISKVLDEANMSYAIFKTIRPYLETTVDIDIIIFGSDEEYRKSIRISIEKGYPNLGSGPNTTTVKDPYIDMGIDLYREIAVSQIIYLDKDKIPSEMIEKKILPNNKTVTTLCPEADLIALIAHSIFKEHMYTISEYYSTLYFLAEMDNNDMARFISLIRNNVIVSAAQVHLGISAKLHKVAYGFVPRKLGNIIQELEARSIEIERIGRNFDTPHKFHPFTVAKALLEKFRREGKTRRSVSRQIASMVKPDFSRSVIKEITRHVMRETY